MIFEANYKTLEKPFLLMKSFLSDADYRTEKHAVTIEVGASVTFSFYDKKSKLEMMFTLDEAEPTLEGVATCSMKALFDVLKSFKKSDDVILIERENNILRVDDGVFPEEILTLYDDEDMVVIEEEEESSQLMTCNGKYLSTALSRASVILKKTDIPADKLDTQSVYLRGSTFPENSMNLSIFSFSIHQSYIEKGTGTIMRDVTLKIPKAVSSLLVRTTSLLEDMHISQGFYDGQEVLLIQDVDKKVKVTIKGEFVIRSVVAEAFAKVSEGLQPMFLKPETVKMSQVELPKKVSAKTNLTLSGESLVETETGYSGKVIKDLYQKGAFDGETKWIEISDEGVLLVYSEDNESKKTITLSYRK